MDHTEYSNESGDMRSHKGHSVDETLSYVLKDAERVNSLSIEERLVLQRVQQEKFVMKRIWLAEANCTVTEILEIHERVTDSRRREESPI